MSEEKKITQENIDNAEVHLHPFLGVSPRKYLPALYGLLLALILFLLLFLPGINNYGSLLVFSGAPAECAVYVDNAFKGDTDQRLFLKAGSYSLRIEHQGFQTEEMKVTIGGRLFGSLFSKKKAKVDYSLKPDKPIEFLDAAFGEFSTWSLSGTPSALYQFPMVLSSAAGDLASTSTLQDGGVFGAGADDKPEMAFMRDILSMTVSPVAARDGLRASIIVGSKGRPGPLSIVANARSFASILAGSKSGSVWLKDLLSQKTYGDYASVAKVAKSSPPDIASAPGIVGRLSAGGQAFVLFSAGKFTLAGQAPSGSAAFYDVLMPPFGIAETEVTNAQWSRFLSENPNWGLGNKAELEKAGLVDPDYLSTWTGVSDSRPVTHISWYAASAYCEWLSKRLPPQYKAVLPSEGMWELAARAATNKSSTQGNTGVWADATRTGPEPVGSAASSPAGLSDMLGNVWEWTNDAYRPYPAFAAWRFSGSEKAVRGGSWANEKDSIDVHSRGGIVAQHSSAFLGFRPAIVQRIAQRIAQR